MAWLKKLASTKPFSLSSGLPEIEEDGYALPTILIAENRLGMIKEIKGRPKGEKATN